MAFSDQYNIDDVEYEAGQVPVGLDRADGVAGRPGTVTPVDAVVVESSDGPGLIPFEELPGSPIFERSEQATIRHTFRCDYAEGAGLMQFLGKGTIWKDSSDLYWKLLSATLTHEQGNSGILETISESMSFDPPWDEFCITPVELGVNILKHPRYFSALEGANSEENKINQYVIRRLQDYFDNISANYRDALMEELTWSMSEIYSGNPSGGPQTDTTDISYPLTNKSGKYVGLGTTPGTDLAKAAALEIIQKYWRNEETPYIVGWRVEWKRYYFRPQYLHPGGVLENPLTGAPIAGELSGDQIPDYFTLTEDGGRLLDWIGYFNPQCYSDTGEPDGYPAITSLRKADQCDHQRTWFKITRTWDISAIGHWDEDLYTSDSAPLTPEDYRYTSIVMPT